jgi:hypothetical protein
MSESRFKYRAPDGTAMNNPYVAPVRHTNNGPDRSDPLYKAVRTIEITGGKKDRSTKN